MLTLEESMRMLVQLCWQAEEAIVRLIDLALSLSDGLFGIVIMV